MSGDVDEVALFRARTEVTGTAWCHFCLGRMLWAVPVTFYFVDMPLRL